MAPATASARSRGAAHETAPGDQRAGHPGLPAGRPQRGPADARV